MDRVGGWRAEAREPAMMALVREARGRELSELLLRPVILRGGRRGESWGELMGRLGEVVRLGVAARERGRRGLGGRGFVNGEAGRGVCVEEADTKLSFDDSDIAVAGRKSRGDVGALVGLAVPWEGWFKPRSFGFARTALDGASVIFGSELGRCCSFGLGFGLGLG